MKNKGIKSILLFPILMGALVGCGNNSSSGIKIKFWHTFGQTIVDGLKPKIRAFQAAVKEHDGISVTVEPIYQGGYDDIAKKISDGYSVGNKPTIAVAYPDNVADYIGIGKSANKEFVVNLEKFINDDEVGFGKESWLGDVYDEDDFVEEFYSEGSRYTVSGTYSLPFMKSTEIMFYNKTLLKKVMRGVHNNPAKATDWDGYDETIGDSDVKLDAFMKNLTWDKFMELCTFIQARMEKIGNMLEVPMWYDSDGNLFITKLFQNNIGYSSVDPATGKGVIDFATGEPRSRVTSMLEDLNDAFTANLFTTKGVKNTYGSDFFTNEKCVFSIGSTGGSGYNFPEQDEFELGVCRVPHSNNTPLYVSQGPTLALFSDDGLSTEKNNQTQLYAWKFLKYITNGQANAEICCNGSEGYVPVRTSAYETRFFQEYMEEETNKYAQCYRVILEDININAGYLVSPAFKGSADLRDNCGTLLTAAIQAAKSGIPALIQKCIDDSVMKF